MLQSLIPRLDLRNLMNHECILSSVISQRDFAFQNKEHERIKLKLNSMCPSNRVLNVFVSICLVLFGFLGDYAAFPYPLPKVTLQLLLVQSIPSDSRSSLQ